MASILAADVAENASRILVACLMLGGAFFVLALGVWYYRRWQRQTSAPSATPWTFEDLRKMVEQGQLSKEEYQILRARIIGEYTGNVVTPDRPPPSEEPQEHWDWVAGEEPGEGGFDVKKQTPG